MSGALALASSLAAMNREALTLLVSSRRVLSPATVHDSLGLAIELLRPDSITRALQSAHREELEALRQLAVGERPDDESIQLLRAAGLLGSEPGGDPVSLPEVTEALSGFDFDPAHRPQGREVPAADTSSWYGPALTTVRRAAQVLRILERRSIRLGRKGKVPVVALRELADAVHADADATDRLVALMRGTGMLTAVPWHDGAEHLVTTPQSQVWLDQQYPERWVQLAEVAVAQIDDRLRLGLEPNGYDLSLVVQHLHIDFPLMPPAEHEMLARVALTAEDLGLTVEGHLTAAARALLVGDDAQATQLAHERMPKPVEGVYLQPDLSLIVPGPLTPADEAALSLVTETEHLGPAASLRLSASSLRRAVRAGVTLAEVRELLERLSLTGIPQPLDYLLNDLARTLEGAGAGDSVSGAGSGMAEGNSARPSDTLSVHTGETAGRAQAPATASRDSELDAMIERVWAASQSEDGDTDMQRRLELAIRNRSSVHVTAVAGNTERSFELLPVSLRGGRLRATDQSAGVERTIPLSAIIAVEV